MDYHFEWDPVKAKRNHQKHQISFQRATTIFRDPLMISIFDDTHSHDEERWVTMGRDEQGVILVASHTFRKMDSAHWTIRMISARKATPEERRQYGENER